jgi:peptidoglycan/xylan/chitin deacetylase (PgdA/CDA1 family)
MTRAAPAARHPLAGLLTVMWHYVRPADAEPAVGAGRIEPERFDAQLDAIGRHRTVVAWGDVAAAISGGRPLPRDAALLTFDDGLADHARTVAPRLLARGWPGVFFVLARRPGEPLTVGHAIHVLLGRLGEDGLRTAVRDGLEPADRARFEIAQDRERAIGHPSVDVLKRPLQRDLAGAVEPLLSRLVASELGPDGDVADALHLGPGDLAAMRGAGMAIGGHGRRHLWLDHAPAAAVRAEVGASARFLSDEARPWAFAYPYGAATPASAAIVAEHGFAAAFRAAPRDPAGRHHLGRIDAEDPKLDALVAGDPRAGPG